MIKAVFFDLDGVLADSLTAHLDFCRRATRCIGLGREIKIPTPKEFKYEVVREGVRISPMYYFLLSLGLNEDEAQKTTDVYERDFPNEEVPLFSGVESALESLSGDLNLPLGLATSNVRASVERALGPGNLLTRFFDSRCVFTHDDQRASSKEEAIKFGAEVLQISHSNILFVGDQLADWEAANATGVQFLGVTYGWGIAQEDSHFPKTDSIQGIVDFVQKG